MVRLDRAFCNSEWELIFPNLALLALSTGVSDHTPILLTRQDRMPRQVSGLRTIGCAQMVLWKLFNRLGPNNSSDLLSV